MCSLFNMQLFVESTVVNPRKRFELDVEPSAAIISAKNMILEKEGICASHQRLKCMSVNVLNLENEKTFAEYKIQSRTTLDLLYEWLGRRKPCKCRINGNAGLKKISVTNLSSCSENTVSLDVEPMDTIAVIKAKLWDKVKVSPPHQKLSYNGVALDDKVTLSEYDIWNGFVLKFDWQTGSVDKSFASWVKNITTADNSGGKEAEEKLRAREKEITALAKVARDAENRVQDLSRRLLCSICMDREASVLYRPCNHLACCTECFETTKKLAIDMSMEHKCPICRKVMKRTFAVFRA